MTESEKVAFDLVIPPRYLYGYSGPSIDYKNWNIIVSAQPVEDDAER